MQEQSIGKCNAFDFPVNNVSLDNFIKLLIVNQAKLQQLYCKVSVLFILINISNRNKWLLGCFYSFNISDDSTDNEFEIIVPVNAFFFELLLDIDIHSNFFFKDIGKYFH